MGFRFRRSFRIAPGVRLNVGSTWLSTTIGGRGASVNIGPRGAYVNAGIPGTGLSYREKIGGGGAASGPGDPTAGSARPGCVGCGCMGMLGFVLLVMLAGMFAADERATAPEPYRGNTLYTADTADTAASTAADGTEEDFYLHSEMNVRSGPGEEHPVLRTVQRGERVRLGPRDANGWAAVFPPDGTGEPAGYLYRAGEQVRTYPPPAADSTPQRAASEGSAGSGGRSSAAGRGYHIGPRGGCYTYTAGGRKRYVDRSFCD